MQARTLVLLSLTIAFVALASGCLSTSSVIATRTADDQLVGNSNGKTGIGQQSRPYKGIPVTMRVPSHLDLSVVETVYYSELDGNYSPVPMPERHLELKHKIVYSDKIITVDPKRPAAGTLAYSAVFQSENDEARDRQFFSSINYNVQDNTINTITALIPSLFPAKPELMSNQSTPQEVRGANLVPKTRTVAWKRFDINAPDFENELSAFVANHVNCEFGCGAIQTAVPCSCLPR